MATVAAPHPVKRELQRLLGGMALCAALVLGAYLLMEAQLDRMRRTQEQFHAPALSLSAGAWNCSCVRRMRSSCASISR